ncbi:MAG: glycoside hydrolase family 13 protein [Planctomycetota bacterium]
MREARSKRAAGLEIRARPDWVADAVFYQIFPDRFASSPRVPKPGPLEPWDSPPTPGGFKGGDLLGIVSRLDYLEDLGVDAIYLNPVFASASNHRYHTYDYHRVDPLLGGDEALRELLDAAHSRGMRVILDGVFNHCGRGFWPFHHVLEAGPQSPYRDWFIVRGWPLRAYGAKGRPNYEAWWGLREFPKLNVSNPQTRAYLLDVAARWIRFGADGWRLDVPNEIGDRTFWREFRRRVRAENSEAYLVGEIWDVAPEWLRGDRFDGLMNYPFSRTAIGACARSLETRCRPGGRKVRRLSAAEALAELGDEFRRIPKSAVFSQLNLLGSHDTPRALTMFRGDRSALWLATLLQMTVPGAPCVYYGDEIGLEGGPDPGCRGAFPWDRSRWDEETRRVFQRAIALRRKEPALRRGSFRPALGTKTVLAFLRETAEDAILVAFNLGETTETYELELPRNCLSRRKPEELWALRAPRPRALAAPRGKNRAALEIAPRSGRVVAFRKGRGSRG